MSFNKTFYFLLLIMIKRMAGLDIHRIEPNLSDALIVLYDVAVCGFTPAVALLVIDFAFQTMVDSKFQHNISSLLLIRIEIVFVHAVAFHIGFFLRITCGTFYTNALNERSPAINVRTCRSCTHVICGRLIRSVLMTTTGSCASECCKNRMRGNVPISLCHLNTLLYIFVFDLPIKVSALYSLTYLFYHKPLIMSILSAVFAVFFHPICI